MDKNPTPGIPGQNIAPDMLTEILVALRDLGLRMAGMEARLEGLDRSVLEALNDEAAPNTEPEPPRVPTLALTSDGRVLLSVHYVEGADLSDRETWTGILLSEAESFDALDAMSDAADDAAAHVGGRIIARSKKRDKPGEGGSE
jgi:hypothetical protein